MKNDKNKAVDTKESKSIGRPKKELDKDVIAKLSQIGCTQEEIGSVVGISARTLQRRFADLVAENKNIGKASLGRNYGKRLLKETQSYLYGYLRTNLTWLIRYTPHKLLNLYH